MKCFDCFLAFLAAIPDPRHHELPPRRLGGGELGGHRVGNGKQRGAMVVSDASQAEAHQIERAGKSERLRVRGSQ